MSDAITARRADWLGLMARARAEDFAAALSAFGPLPEHRLLRAPEIGMVMVRGRMGATGDPFNLGEMAVTRCSVVLAATGVAGHGYIAGRRLWDARAIACFDALLQSDATHKAVAAQVLAPLAAAEARRAAETAAATAATRVQFSTLQRGEG